MANQMRVLRSHLPGRAYSVKGSAEAIQVGDLVFWDARFQANTSQQTLRPAGAGSAGANAGDGRYQFANLFAGVAMQRHDLNSFDKDLLVCVDGEIEMTIANSTGTATAATSDIAPGTKVGVAVNASFVPLNNGLCQIDGHHSVTVADNQAIGYLARKVKSGDETARVHIKGVHVFSQTGI